MNFKRILIFVLTAFFICAPYTLAAIDCTATGLADVSSKPSAVLSILCPIQSAIWLGMFFVGAVLIILILYGAIKAVMSTGDSRQLEGAKMVWTYAILGALVILLAVFIVQIAFGLLGSWNTPFSLVGTLENAFTRFWNCLQTGNC